MPHARSRCTRTVSMPNGAASSRRLARHPGTPGRLARPDRAAGQVPPTSRGVRPAPGRVGGEARWSCRSSGRTPWRQHIPPVTHAPYHAGVRFLLATLHRAAFRQQVEVAGVPLDHAPDLVDVRCPRCDALFVADLAPGEEPWDLEAREWAADDPRQTWTGFSLAPAGL